MTRPVKILVLLILAAALGGVLLLKGQKSPSTERAQIPPGLPRLIDLSTSNCPACKAILPHIEQLKADYAGVLDVEVVDVWADQAMGQKYGVRYVPTLVLLDAEGEVLERREGFMPLEDLTTLVESHGISRP